MEEEEVQQVQQETSNDIPLDFGVTPASPTSPGFDISLHATKRLEVAGEIVDPVFALRAKQWEMYERLCLEMRLKHNSGVKSALYPRKDSDLNQSGQDLHEEENLVPTKISEDQENRPASPLKDVLALVCPCGNAFLPDAVFCRQCGQNRGYMTIGEGCGVFCGCGNRFAKDAVFCRKCGSKRPTLKDKIATEKEIAAQKARAVHEYTFMNHYLGDKMIMPLGGALAMDRQIVAISLPGVGMRDYGMVFFCDQLKRSPTLEFVDISENRFSIIGAEACLRLAIGARRMVLLKSTDTCLDEDFITRRGLPNKYGAVRRQVHHVLTERQKEIERERELREAEEIERERQLREGE